MSCNDFNSKEILIKWSSESNQRDKINRDTFPFAEILNKNLIKIQEKNRLRHATKSFLQAHFSIHSHPPNLLFACDHPWNYLLPTNLSVFSQRSLFLTSWSPTSFLGFPHKNSLTNRDFWHFLCWSYILLALEVSLFRVCELYSHCDCSDFLRNFRQ